MFGNHVSTIDVDQLESRRRGKQMTIERIALPLSPPTTPRMPDSADKVNENAWQNRSATAFNNTSNLPRGEETSLLHSSPIPHQLSIAPRSIAPAQPLLPFPEAERNAFLPLDTSSLLQDEDIADDELMADDEVDVDFGEQQEGTERAPMTAEELRAHKRKMKRFRLTHSQTRYLVSEFARNAHPDASHRDRLAREIPGMSPRRIQVWFQNRRAKLKRLTTDDRERMMSSRTLPADFDTKQALRFEYGVPTPKIGADQAPSASQTTPTVGSGEQQRQQVYQPAGPSYEPPNQPGGSSNVTPAIGGFTFTPPQAATGTMSSTSTASNMSTPNVYLRNSPTSHRYSAPYTMHPYADYHAHLAGLQGQRARPGGAAASPAQSSTMYSETETENAYTTQPRPRAHSASIQQPQTQWRPLYPRSTTNPTVAGLGFYYPQAPSYQQYAQPQQPPPGSYTQPSTDKTTYPPPGNQISPVGPTYTQQYTPILTSPHETQYYRFGSHTEAQPYQFTFQTPSMGVQQVNVQPRMNRPRQYSYPHLPTQSSQLRVLTNEQQGGGGDNTGGGVPLSPSYWDASKIENVPTSFA